MPVSRILCVSANPAMDRRLHVDALSSGGIIRANSAAGYAGGKAAHVAMAVRALGLPAAWIGFLGGAIGDECSQQLAGLGIEVASVRTAASTRVNLEVIEASGRVTEILEPGSAPEKKAAQEFLSKIKGISAGALLVISGSLPAGLERDFYFSISEIAQAQGGRTFLDTSGEALQAGAKGNVDFVKTNRAEAETLVGRSLKNTSEIVHAAKEIMQRGPRSVAITSGAEGIIWVEDKIGPVWNARPPRLQAISTVGCGDATLGGFACAAVKGMAGEEAIRLAAACGAANCLAAAPGRIELAQVQTLLPQIKIEQLAL
jgi:1-phosphofructokinase family hexose kinase